MSAFDLFPCEITTHILELTIKQKRNMYNLLLINHNFNAITTYIRDVKLKDYIQCTDAFYLKTMLDYVLNKWKINISKYNFKYMFDRSYKYTNEHYYCRVDIGRVKIEIHKLYIDITGLFKKGLKSVNISVDKLDPIIRAKIEHEFRFER